MPKKRLRLAEDGLPVAASALDGGNRRALCVVRRDPSQSESGLAGLRGRSPAGGVETSSSDAKLPVWFVFDASNLRSMSAFVPRRHAICHQVKRRVPDFVVQASLACLTRRADDWAKSRPEMSSCPMAECGLRQIGCRSLLDIGAAAL